MARSQRFRIVVSYARPLLRDIVRNATMHEPDLEFVAAVEQPEPLGPVLESAQADVVVIEAAVPDDLSFAKQVWAKWPRLRVLTIAQGGRSAVLQMLRPDSVLYRDVSPQALVAAIRGGPGW